MCYNYIHVVCNTVLITHNSLIDLRLECDLLFLELLMQKTKTMFSQLKFLFIKRNGLHVNNFIIEIFLIYYNSYKYKSCSSYSLSRQTNELSKTSNLLQNKIQIDRQFFLNKNKNKSWNEAEVY